MLKCISFFATIVCIYGEEYLMLPGTSENCLRPNTRGFYKSSSSDDLLLHNQIIFNWNPNASEAHIASAPKSSRNILTVCPGVNIRPAGRYVKRFLPDGSVYFWLLHVRASIQCPSTPRYDNPSESEFQLRFEQWIVSSEHVSPSEFDEAYEGGEPVYRIGQGPPANVTLSCNYPQRELTLRGRLRKLRVSWHLLPSRLSNLTANITAADIFSKLPSEPKMRVQVTSRLHFDGNFSLTRKRDLCEYYGFWCYPPVVEAGSKLGDPFQDEEEEDEVNGGTCIRPSMHCDGMPDCWPADPLNSPDEIACPPIPSPDSSASTSSRFGNSINGSESRSIDYLFGSGRGHSWTSKLPWLVVAFVPAVLLCALVRICSQRRQLDFADEMVGDGGEAGVGSSYNGLQMNPTTYKLRTAKRRLPWTAGLRRTKSFGQLTTTTITASTNGTAVLLTSKRSIQDFRSSKLKIDEVEEDEELSNTADGGSERCCNLKIDIEQPAEEVLFAATAEGRRYKRPNSEPLKLRLNSGRAMMSCWSEISSSSTSSSSSPSSTSSRRRRRRLQQQEEEQDGVMNREPEVSQFLPYPSYFNSSEMVESCDVCRQMVESGIMDHGSRGSLSSESDGMPPSPSTTSTSGCPQRNSEERENANLVTEGRSSKDLKGKESGVPVICNDPLFEHALASSISHSKSQFSNPLHSDDHIDAIP